MDGIARNTSGLDSGLTDALTPLLLLAVGLLVAGGLLALGGEVLHRTGRAHHVARTLDRVLPRRLRRLAAATVTVSLAVLGPAPAHASDGPVRDWLSGNPSTTSTTAVLAGPMPVVTGPVATEDRLAARLDPGPTTGSTPTTTTTFSSRSTTSTTTTTRPVRRVGEPRAPIAAPEPIEATRPVPAPDGTPTGETYVVVEGDCLWSIAAAHLDPDASNLAIDAAWRAIYASNAASIGADPNLIFPGTELELPPFDPSRHAP